MFLHFLTHKPTYLQNENIGKNFSILAKNKINWWSILNIFMSLFLNFLKFTFLLFVIIIVVKREQRHSVLSDETGNRSYPLRYQVEYRYRYRYRQISEFRFNCRLIFFVSLKFSGNMSRNFGTLGKSTCKKLSGKKIKPS